MNANEKTTFDTAAGATVNADNPWPGLLAFRESDQGYFQGRQAETEELLRLVLRERLTVLFGLSGLGKSSLLQAGLFPKLRQENLFPVYIRLDFSSAKPNLVAQVYAIVAREASACQIEAPQPQNDETLWEYFHREANSFWNARNKLVMPLFVFDQFEEVFTLGRLDPDRSKVTSEFIEQLADLSEGRPPARLKAWIDDHPEEASGFNFGRNYYKVLLSIREDFLPDLEALRASMPTLALNRMRLRRMNGEAALLVVNQAEHLIDPDVGEQVVRFVAADQRHLPLAELEVEPALLSVVCRELNNRRLALKEPKISAGLLQGSQEQVLADFYERSTADLAPEIRLFIEDHLLTVSGYRDSVALDNALRTPGVTREAIDTLVERRLMRREDRGGTQRLELTHDLLAGVVRASRDSRRQKEAAEKERAALLQAQEQQSQALEEAQEEERRNRDRRDLRLFRIATVVFLLLTVIAVGTAVWAWRAQRKADEASREAQTESAQAQTARDFADHQRVEAEEQAKKLAASVGILSKLNEKDVQAAVESQSTADLLPRVYMHILNENDRDYAKQISARLTAAGVLVMGIQYVPNVALKKTDVRFYRKVDEPEAKVIVGLLKEAGETSAWPNYLVGYENSTEFRPNHFEVWIANRSGGNSPT